jgi:hypothetical protein
MVELLERDGKGNRNKAAIMAWGLKRDRDDLGAAAAVYKATARRVRSWRANASGWRSPN